MKFTPKSETEVSNLLPDGVYDAEIGTAEDKISRAGSEMIKLDVTVFDKAGNKRFVYDYLLEAMAYKLRHAAKACGVIEKYEAGVLSADDFIGKSCKVKIKTDDKSIDYPPKNVISDYIVPEKPFVAKGNDELLNDSVPF